MTKFTVSSGKGSQRRCVPVFVLPASCLARLLYILYRCCSRASRPPVSIVCRLVRGPPLALTKPQHWAAGVGAVGRVSGVSHVVQSIFWRRTHRHARACVPAWCRMQCEPRETHHCLAKLLKGSSDECVDDDGNGKRRRATNPTAKPMTTAARRQRSSIR